jgi:hypothetical protein
MTILNIGQAGGGDNPEHRTSRGVVTQILVIGPGGALNPTVRTSGKKKKSNPPTTYPHGKRRTTFKMSNQSFIYSFFSPVQPDVYERQVQRTAAEVDAARAVEKVIIGAPREAVKLQTKAQRKAERKLKNTERRRRVRAKKKQEEIAAGIRDAASGISLLLLNFSHLSDA